MKLKIISFFAKKENLYLSLALFFGFFMVFFNPPFAGVPDEGAHFLRAWGISQGSISCDGNGEINKAAYGLAEELKPIKTVGNNDSKISLGKIKKALFEKDSQENIPFAGAVCGSNPLGYFPQILGIELSRIFGAPVLWGFYLARLFNLLAAVGLTYLAIRLVPFGKIIFLLIALLPMTMQQYASFSYDPLHISMIFLFVAYSLKLAVGDEKISRKEMILLSVAAILAANVKFGFLPVLLLLFIFPLKKFKTKKQYAAFILVTVFLSLLFFYVGQKSAISSEGAREGVYPLEQLLIVLKNPFGFLYVVLNTVYEGSTFFFESFLYKPGWLKVCLPFLWYVFVLFGMIALVRSENEKVDLEKWQRFVLGLTFLAGFLFVFFSLYVFWSKIGGEKIQGVQGRYFLAIFPLIIFAFYKSNFDFRVDWIRKNINKAIAMFVVIFFFFTIFSLWNIYYDKSEVNGKYIYEQQLDKSQRDVAEVLPVQKSFHQTLLVNKDGFLGVKLYVKKGAYTGKATMYLKDESCQNILRKKEAEWDADEFGSMEIKFGELPNSQGKKLCIEGILSSEPQLLFKVSEGVYVPGQAQIDGIESDKDLIFDLMYEN